MRKTKHFRPGSDQQDLQQTALKTAAHRLERTASMGLWIALALSVCTCGPATEKPQPPPTKPLVGWRSLAKSYSRGGVTGAWSAGAAGSQRSWAMVGGDGTDSFVLELSGDTWSHVAIKGVPLLWWVYGDGEGNRAAVGDGGTLVTWKAGDLAAHKAVKVTRIKELQSAGVALYGVWFAAGAKEYWVVGGNPKTGPGSGLIWRVAASSLDGDPGASASRVVVGDKQGIVFKIIGVGDERWAVGDGGVIWHGKDASWTVEATIATDVLIGIAGTKADALVTVGGRGAGVVARRTAAGWTQVAGGKNAWISGLSAVTLLANGTAIVGGSYGFLGKQDDSTTKDDLPGLDPPLTSLTLHGAWADSHSQVLVGGSFDNPATPIVGVVLIRGDDLPALP